MNCTLRRSVCLIGSVCVISLASWNSATGSSDDDPPGISSRQPRPSREDASRGDSRTRSGDGASMVAVPAGTFLMGSTLAEVDDAIALCGEHYSPCNRWYYMREHPRHVVALDGFWLDRTEVTNARYSRCVEDGRCQEPSTCKKGEPTYADEEKSDHPVVCVDWHDARSYCRWAGARLPTEAEWEYAFRGEQGSLYPWGDTFDGAMLNYCDANCEASHADNRYDDGYAKTCPAGSYPAGASWSGASGMGGNVSEWVADWFGDYTPGAIANPLGPSEGNEKLVKGCSWFFHPAYCRGATRASIRPETRFDYLGFRCAASLDDQLAARPAVDELTFEAPRGSSPFIDGTFSPGEWAGARRVELSSGELLFTSDGGYLYIGIRSELLGLGSLCVHRGDEVDVLHSSAALGTATYTRTDADDWLRTRSFNWTNRDGSQSRQAQEALLKHLQEEGWLANNAHMGEPGEMEYQIAMPDGRIRLAVTYLESPDYKTAAVWPEGLKDDCRELELLRGETPGSLIFVPDTWMTVTTSTEGGEHPVPSV